MSPKDFIPFAEKLLASATEADPAAMRTIVSRAYYGAYLQARIVLTETWGQPPFRGGNEHLFVQQLFLNCQVLEGKEIGKLLQSLHERRKDADYEMKEVYIESRTNAELSIISAWEIVSKLDAHTTGIVGAQIRAGITQYRRIRQA
jgi:uncharacterized protein (UPF0332 family)